MRTTASPPDRRGSRATRPVCRSPFPSRSSSARSRQGHTSCGAPASPFQTPPRCAVSPPRCRRQHAVRRHTPLAAPPSWCRTPTHVRPRSCRRTPPSIASAPAPAAALSFGGWQTPCFGTPFPPPNAPSSLSYKEPPPCEGAPSPQVPRHSRTSCSPRVRPQTAASILRAGRYTPCPPVPGFGSWHSPPASSMPLGIALAPRAIPCPTHPCAPLSSSNTPR